MTTHAVSIDVEDYFHVANFFDVVARDAWESMPSRVERNVDRVLGILDESGVKATFFALGWVAERHGAVIRKIADAGHEVGSHGWSHGFVQDLGPEAFRDEARRSKALLEDLTGKPVHGFRASTFTITRKTYWALAILAEEGYRYDSSIFPVRHHRYGIPDFPIEPQRLELENGSALVEFPPLVYRRFGRNWPAAGGGYFRLFPYWFTRHALRVADRAGRSAVFYLHPWEFDPEQPRLQASRLARFRHYVNLHRTGPRLRALLREARFAPIVDVLVERGLLTGTAREPTRATS